MKKYFILVLSLLLCFIFTGCGQNSNNNNINDSNVEEQVVSMFMKYATFDYDGVYRFRKRDSLGDVTFSYCFSYSPSIRRYNANVLVSTYGSITLYDYASVTFSWGNFKRGYFYAYHELEYVAKIEFSYNNLTFSNNTIGSRYTYKVESNSFSGLTAKADIDRYAADGYEALQQAISYMNSILSRYNLLVALY